MKKEFEFRMKCKFPLLYRDMWGDCRRTCMSFGLDVGDGWAGIIEDVSAKLEPKIQKIKKELESSSNLKCENCLRPKRWHWWFVFIDYLRKWAYILRNWLPSISKNYKEERAKIKMLGKYGFKFKWNIVFRKPYKNMCCTEFRVPYPCAAQIKEKFGSLRIYLTYSNNELEKIISEAVKKSQTVCECCGREAKLRDDDGWWKTICDKCV